MKKQAISAAELLLTAFIWGVAFVAQSVGMDYIGPFTFNCVRSIIGGLVLIPLVMILGKKNRADKTAKEAKEYKKNTVTGGICCGICLCVASCFQQFGIMHTTVGKAGFITALYIIIVPILGIFMKKKVAPIVWVSSVIAVIGFYLLSISGQVSINKGDILVLICAVLFSIHILVIDFFSPKGEGVTISCIQFITCGILCGICMFLFENPQISDILAAYLPILYAGVMSCGVAYTLQIIGQKNMDPTVASLILSLESVFSALAGWLILGQGLSGKELIGCGLVFVAVLLAQMPQKSKN
jgi:drug/metabolite transporter (DMT)-like permease